ncbi:hypothetical protein [Rahnella aquatilis]|uniref:hypothetical protein n=1 Tax=Rahnella aquatilis TaxID=34038 RepID=UPI0009E08B4F|nr:hypothetical protein [Rahnella aquatilis]
MNRSGNNEIGKIIAALGVLLLLGFGIWIMKTFDVSFTAASNTTFRLIAWGVAVVALIAWHSRSDFNVIKNTTPLVISLFWCSLFPLLDYKAGIRDDFPIQIDISWYGTAFWQFVIFMAINFIGYGIIYFQNKRNNYHY